MYSIGELKAGLAVVIDGDPHVILKAQHSKQARQGGVAKTKIKNLVSGAILQKTFQGNDKLEPAAVTYSKAQYLYGDGEGFHFMDGDSFEQFTLDADLIGDLSNFLVEGEDSDIQNFEGRHIGIKVAPKVAMEVTHTDPGVKGDTASGGSKPCTVSSGFTLQVPLFINIGDKIRINTESGNYVERA